MASLMQRKAEKSSMETTLKQRLFVGDALTWRPAKTSCSSMTGWWASRA
jgi:hypothetical protein